MDVIIEHPGWLSYTIEDWRNIVLIGVGVIGLPLAIWRSWTAYKQVKLAEAGQNLDRYQKGAAMLGDNQVTVRVAGIFGLHRLVTTDPKNYYVTVIKLLVSFICERSRRSMVENDARISMDSELAITMISRLRQFVANEFGSDTWWQTEINLSENYFVGADLSNLILDEIDFRASNFFGAQFGDSSMKNCLFDFSDFSTADFHGANCENSNFNEANLTDTIMLSCDLRQSSFYMATLSHANLDHANLQGAKFRIANLANARLTGADLKDTKFDGADLIDITWNLYGYELSRSNAPINASHKQFEQAKNVDPEFLEWLSSEQNKHSFHQNP